METKLSPLKAKELYVQYGELNGLNWIESAIGLVKFKDKNRDVWPRLMIPALAPQT